MIPRPVVISLFDYTGEAVRPWAEAGYLCLCLDQQHRPGSPDVEMVGPTLRTTGIIWKAHADLSTPLEAAAAVKNLLASFDRTAHDVHFVFGWPPCTDLASSGARHWEKKRQADPFFQAKAIRMAVAVEFVARALRAPYLIENPVGALCTKWRKPNHKFNPCDFGGYCPEGPHPRWPEYIPEQDAYTKRTCLWTGNGFVMPDLKPVEPVTMTVTRTDGTTTSGSPAWAKLGGKSLKTKNIRSATPRGFARAVFEANCPLMKRKEAA